jgi:hypothetical protein
MSMFEELQQSYGKSAEEAMNYRVKLWQFAKRFAKGFKKYIGAPKSFTDGDGQTQRYVEPREVIINTSGDEETAGELSVGSLIPEDDGLCKFAVRLVLDQGINTFPKTAISYRVHFRLVEDVCELKIAGGSFSFGVNDSTKWVPAYEQMVLSLKANLNRKPWDVVPEKKTIGFLDEAVLRKAQD